MKKIIYCLTVSLLLYHLSSAGFNRSSIPVYAQDPTATPSEPSLTPTNTVIASPTTSPVPSNTPTARPSNTPQPTSSSGNPTATPAKKTPTPTKKAVKTTPTAPLTPTVTPSITPTETPTPTPTPAGGGFPGRFLIWLLIVPGLGLIGAAVYLHKKKLKTRQSP